MRFRNVTDTTVSRNPLTTKNTKQHKQFGIISQSRIKSRRNELHDAANNLRDAANDRGGKVDRYYNRVSL